MRADNDSELQGNAEVVAFVSDYVAMANSPKSFAMDEKAIIVALHAFGASKFDHWYFQQFKSPAFGNTHQDFIDDTIRFIETGHRDMQLEVWAGIIGYNDRVARPKKASDICQSFIDSKTGTDGLNMTEIVRAWLSQPNGMKDLVMSLNILFGNM